jgi:hypothetical protein
MNSPPGALRVSESAQVRALHDTAFLAAFQHPTSPSQVAQHLNIGANLAHYRARRYVSLGLLQSAGRDGKRILYRLAAKSFSYPAHLLTPGGPGDTVQLLFQRLCHGLTHCEARLHHDDQLVTVRFNDVPTEPQARPAPGGVLIKQLTLTAERRQVLMDRLAQVLQEFSDDPCGQAMTVALVHFQGVLEE